MLNINSFYKSYNSDSINNLFLSDQALENDINESDILIYRGSATVIQAAEKGVFPIYFNNNENLNIDPLYEINNKSLYLNNYQNFEELLNYYTSHWINDNVNNDYKNSVISYSNIYFQKFNYNKIIDILK